MRAAGVHRGFAWIADRFAGEPTTPTVPDGAGGGGRGAPASGDVPQLGVVLMVPLPVDRTEVPTGPAVADDGLAPSPRVTRWRRSGVPGDRMRRPADVATPPRRPPALDLRIGPATVHRR